jgi:hypothetical protein
VAIPTSGQIANSLPLITNRSLISSGAVAAFAALRVRQILKGFAWKSTNHNVFMPADFHIPTFYANRYYCRWTKVQ